MQKTTFSYSMHYFKKYNTDKREINSNKILMFIMNKILVIMKNRRVLVTFQMLMFGLVLLIACNRRTNEMNNIKIETDSFTDS